MNMRANPRPRRTDRAETSTTPPVPPGHERVTLLLGTETVVRLNQMASAAGFNGIGRTIRALVDSVVDSRSNLDGLVRSSIVATMAQKASPADREQLHAQLLLTFSVNSVIMAERFNKLLGVKADAIAAEVLRDLSMWPGMENPGKGEIRD
jgi:hypothetical protein